MMNPGSSGTSEGFNNRNGHEPQNYLQNLGQQRIQLNQYLYTCYCSKIFGNSQALGGHQNAHRRERDALKREYETHRHPLTDLTLGIRTDDRDGFIPRLSLGLEDQSSLGLDLRLGLGIGGDNQYPPPPPPPPTVGLDLRLSLGVDRQPNHIAPNYNHFDAPWNQRERAERPYYYFQQDENEGGEENSLDDTILDTETESEDDDDEEIDEDEEGLSEETVTCTEVKEESSDEVEVTSNERRVDLTLRL